jgi:hypothetical protein
MPLAFCVSKLKFFYFYNTDIRDKAPDKESVDELVDIEAKILFKGFGLSLIDSTPKVRRSLFMTDRLRKLPSFQ